MAGFSPASLGGIASFKAVPKEVQDFLPNLFQLESQVHQHLGGNPVLFSKQAKQDMFGTNVVMVQIPSFLHRVLDDFLGAWGLRQFPHGDHFRATLDEFLDLQSNLAKIHIQVFQYVGRNTTSFLDETQQDVFRANVLVVESLGLLVGQLHHLACSISKSLVHFLSPFPAWTGYLLSSSTRG